MYAEKNQHITKIMNSLSNAGSKDSFAMTGQFPWQPTAQMAFLPVRAARW